MSTGILIADEDGIRDERIFKAIALGGSARRKASLRFAALSKP